MTAFLVWLILQQQPVAYTNTTKALDCCTETFVGQIHINKSGWYCRETDTEWICEQKKPPEVTP